MSLPYVCKVSARIHSVYHLPQGLALLLREGAAVAAAPSHRSSQFWVVFSAQTLSEESRNTDPLKYAHKSKFGLQTDALQSLISDNPSERNHNKKKFKIKMNQTGTIS